jgi:hypothetical protein
VPDEHVHAGELGQTPHVTAIGPRQHALIEEPGGAPVEQPVAAATGLLRERAGDVGFPGAACPRDRHVLVLLHPTAGRELADDGFVQLAPRRVVDVLDAGLAELQLGLA